MSGAAEVVHGAGFVLQNPESVTELAAQIMRLFDEKLRAELGSHAREKAEGLGWEMHMNGMLSIFHEVYEKKLMEQAEGNAR